MTARGVYSIRAVRRARRAALAEMADRTHWLSLQDAALLVPCDVTTLKKYLAIHTTACDWCPVYRARGRQPGWRVLSPADIRPAQRVILMRTPRPPRRR